MDNFFDDKQIKISIEKTETIDLVSGHTGTIFYVNLFNNTNKKINIDNIKSFTIDNDKKQHEPDTWLSGYISYSGQIRKNAYATTGAIFYKNKFKNVFPGFRHCFQFKDDTNDISYDAEFVLNEENLWVLDNCDINAKEMKPSPKQLKKKLKQTIERLEVLEEKFGVNLKKINILINDYSTSLSVLGEIHAIKGDTIPKDVKVSVSLYNIDGELLKSSQCHFYSKRFFAFDTFDVSLSIDEFADEIAKILVYVN
jgi:hypothetical protein